MYDHYKGTKCGLAKGTDNFRFLTSYKACWDENEKSLAMPVKNQGK